MLLLVKELIKQKIVVKFLVAEESLGDKKVLDVLVKVLLELFNGLVEESLTVFNLVIMDSKLTVKKEY